MSKKNQQNEEVQQPEECVAEGTAVNTPSYVEELMKTSTTVLRGKTRDELANMVNDIPHEVRYSTGAIGYNPATGDFSLRVDIINS